MRRKILESLCSLAVNVVKSYLVGHPNATSDDLIEVLEVTFGPVGSTTEMLYRFHSTFHKEKKFLSVHVLQLEQGLRLLVSHGVITGDKINSLRRRVTLNSNPLATTIRAHYQDKLPPGYVVLMERGEPESQLRLRKFLSVIVVASMATSSQTVQSRMTQSAQCKLRHWCKRFYGRCYKCQVVGHQAWSCKTYKSSTVQKSSICESDSREDYCGESCWNEDGP
ncbi:hypothetical protein XELAEV_18037164mg [Xenopus laevis]|uniref:Paraneoplastic antigen Ma-like C-terminal domain-containing protein n=1 Tax=Xenopus laevis TaxID=8355 RepID=A0A974CC91_XENLA|nr:hypothetical protein XELAEV_18037164mg [Xenopus laevis]